MMPWVYLIVGGIVGTVARYAVSGVVAQRMGGAFPWGTLVVNVAGCFVIGFADTFLERKCQVSPHYRILLMTGFCGAFTTFSALILETSNLLKSHAYLYAFGNILISLALGFAAFKLGMMMAELV
jgi:CrcB protein